MTEIIDGKQYRWTAEGTADHDGNLWLKNGGTVWCADLAAGTCELLPDPLPTAPGSVVRWLDLDCEVARTLVRLTPETVPSHHWVDVDGLGRYNDATVEGATVLFDAGSDPATAPAEKPLNPLPTAPGSVVRHDGRTWLRRAEANNPKSDYFWVDARGNVEYDGGMAYDAIVLFDAGVQR